MSSNNSVNDDVPDHQFKVESVKYKTGKCIGKTRYTVTLEIPPYLFKRRYDGKTIGKNAIFTCNGCQILEECSIAKAIRRHEDDEEPKYQLMVR